MKKFLFILCVICAVASFAAAQITTTSDDVLGAHLNYGRGCAGCHAPHSGAYGNGNAKTADDTSGNHALWGQDVGSIKGQTFTFAGDTAETLPALDTTNPRPQHHRMPELP